MGEEHSLQTRLRKTGSFVWGNRILVAAAVGLPFQAYNAFDNIRRGEFEGFTELVEYAGSGVGSLYATSLVIGKLRQKYHDKFGAGRKKDYTGHWNISVMPQHIYLVFILIEIRCWVWMPQKNMS